MKTMCAKDEPINVFEKLLPHFSCNCEKMMDDMVGRWRCPVHGKCEPNYAQIRIAEELDAQERRIMAAESLRDERRERLPGDHDGLPSNEQMEYFKRGGR
jgi:hypothetical protein